MRFAPGFFSPYVGSGEYYACPSGLYSPSVGASACIGKRLQSTMRTARALVFNLCNIFSISDISTFDTTFEPTVDSTQPAVDSAQPSTHKATLWSTRLETQRSA